MARPPSSRSPPAWAAAGRTGAGVVKAVNPFVMLAGQASQLSRAPPGQDRRRLSASYGVKIPHVVTTSFLTHPAIEHHLAQSGQYGHDRAGLSSRAVQSIGQRLVPMARDLTFPLGRGFAAGPRREQAKGPRRRPPSDPRLGTIEGRRRRLHRQRPRPAVQPAGALLRGADLAPQRRAGPDLLDEFPNLNWLLVHNIDTLGANLDPGVLGLAMETGFNPGLRGHLPTDR